ncbi:MAG TPA: DinB family protein [Alphaproteobacteria bacterium]|nr:DinB family protein [Alphaproteobacteria bacterium]
MNNAEARQKFLEIWDREFQITMKILKAFPENRQDYKPHELSKSAKDLAWVFASEERVVFEGIVDGNIQWEKMTPAPETLKEVIALYEVIHRDAMEKVRTNEISGTVQFFTAPKVVGNLDKLELLWMMLHDHIHHRGQFSIYLRLVGAKVPSIYGPSADEPWN